MVRNINGYSDFYDKDTYQTFYRPADNLYPGGSDIMNRSLNGYLKVGIPLNEDNTQNIAFVGDYAYQDMD